MWAGEGGVQLRSPGATMTPALGWDHCPQDTAQTTGHGSKSTPVALTAPKPHSHADSLLPPARPPPHSAPLPPTHPPTLSTVRGGGIMGQENMAMGNRWPGCLARDTRLRISSTAAGSKGSGRYSSSPAATACAGG